MPFKQLIAATLLGLSINLPASAQRLESLKDVPEGHWARPSIKLLMNELGVMRPKSPGIFAGHEEVNRYELALILSRTIEKLEEISGRDLKALTQVRPTKMNDLPNKWKQPVNAAVNEIGIMLAMPGQKFMGSDPISRYTLCLDLQVYFKSLEKAGISPQRPPRKQFQKIHDIPEDHWARNAVKDCIDKYQIFNASPSGKFNGKGRLNRYATAAIVREVVRYMVDEVIPQMPASEAKP